MSTHPKPGGTLWWHFKYAHWMLMAGEFNCRQFSSFFKLRPNAGWELLSMAVDAGFLETGPGPSKRGRPTQYKVMREEYASSV